MAKSATISLDLDVSAFRKSLSSAISGAKSLAGLKPSVKVGVDTSQVDAAEDKIDGLSGTQTVKVDVDTKGAEKSAGGFASKLGGLGAIAGGALGGAAIAGLQKVGGELIHGAKAADEFGDSLEVAFTKQGIADVGAEIEKTAKSTLSLANDLGLPVARTRELAVSVASLGGFTGKSAEDLTKLSAGLEVFTNGAVKGEAVAKAFSRGIADPEGAAAIEALSKKYPQLAETLRSNLSPSEKLAKANEVLGKSFQTVADQQSDVGGILNKLQNQLADVFEKIGGDLLNALIPIAQAVLPVVESLLPILQTFLAALTPVLSQVAGVIVQLVQSLSGPVTKLLQSVMEPLIGIIGQLLPVILQIVERAMVPLSQIIDVVAELFRQLFPALQPIIDLFLELLPVAADLVVQLINGLVPVIRALVPLFVSLVKLITENKVIMGAFRLVLSLVAGALQIVVNVIDALAKAATFVIGVITNVITYISNLVNAIASFDLAAIKNAILGISDAQNKGAKSAKANAEATKEATEAATELSKTPPPPPPPDPEAAKKYAEALKAARVALAGLNIEQAKARELAAADTLSEETDRAKARLEIETRYQVDAIEAERKSLKSRGTLRQAEEAVINKRLEMLREESAGKLREIEAKVQADRVKAADEAEKKITEITTQLAEERVARLQSILEAGGIGVADELLKAQRAIVDNQLSQTIDAIAESTPGFKRYAAKIANDLANGLIDADEARLQTASLRQGIIDELLALPADAGNVYAVQLQDAYDKAAKEIATGTQGVTDSIKKAIGKSGTEQYVKSLYGIREAIAGADFSTPFKESAEATQASTDALNELIDSVKAGEETYQSATLKYAELDKERGESATATAAVITEALRAAAQSQLDAANASIDRITELRNRNQEIADELIAIEERKNAALAALRAEDFANQQLFETAKAEINQKAAIEEQKLKAEQTANTEATAKAQEAALLQIGTAAGTAFAGLVTGSKEAGEALKSIVGDTVSALLKLYTPSIIAGFQSIVPGPIGFVLGTAAVATLQALLSSALAGFSEGGYTGNVGTSQVAGVVHGREFVINAGATQKNRAILEHINAGGTLDTFGAAPISEMQMMRAELQAIRQRLDSMPNGINGRQAVALDVGFDTYLFERDRRRVAVRGIRG